MCQEELNTLPTGVAAHHIKVKHRRYGALTTSNLGDIDRYNRLKDLAHNIHIHVNVLHTNVHMYTVHVQHVYIHVIIHNVLY